MRPIIEVQGLCKSLGDFKLNEVSFSLTEGCITGFIGVNGAGKTTTIKLILGLLRRDAGSILFRGKETRLHETDFKNRIGIVLDEGCFYDELTLTEMKSILAPAYTDWDEPMFRSHMDRFRLLPNQKISTLSKGMRMKYSIALALSHHADVLIMDEPASGLDPQVRLELTELLLDFVQEEGKTVFLSTHITSDLDKIADELVLIHRGRILLSEDKDQLLDRHGLVKGDPKELNDRTREMFLSLQETAYGFIGLTDDKNAVRREIRSALIERPTVEDMMLSYIRREP